MAARRIKPPHDPEADEYVRQLNKRQIGSWLIPESKRTYFRFPDGRLGSMRGLSMRVELDDPFTANAYLEKMRDWNERYELKDGRIVLTERGKELKEQERKEREVKKAQPPEWYDAEYFEPERTGKYKCVVERGFFRKRTEEMNIHYKTRVSGVLGDWLKPFGTNVIKWLDDPL